MLPPKTVRYTLITGVIFIWGAIIYKVVAGFGEKTPAPKKQVAADYTTINLEKEDFYLFANYPDPFIPGEDGEDTGFSKLATPLPPVSSPPPPPVEIKPDLSFIQYHGLIANNDNKIKIALISLNGKEILIREKDEREEVLFRKIHPDKLEITYKNKKYTISKN